MNSLNTSLRVLLPILEELGTAIALSVAIKLRHGDVAGVLRMSADPRHYCNADRYLRDIQAISLLKKVKGLDVKEIDRPEATLEKWWIGERQCYKSNERLSRLSWGLPKTPADEAIVGLLQRSSELIRSWIGDRPPTLDNVEGRFGPGATFSDRGKLTTIPDKMTTIPTLTRRAVWHLLPYLQTAWARAQAARKQGGEVSWVRGNRFMTVPKTGLIDRAIAVEPAINVFYQLGYGSSIRKRFRSATGWDLDRAADVHRKMARQSSITREFATLDLSNASDTVSLELVRLLLPPAWFDILSELRSPFTKIGDHWCKLEKFSSMGNGFTFELETLIFSALCCAALQSIGRSGQMGVDVFVFGDDIIVPDDSVRLVVAVLAFCGFTLNGEKSFHGPVGFRESCGGDFFEGADVRPFYLKDLKDDPWTLIPDVNGLYRVSQKLKSIAGLGLDYSIRIWRGLLPSAANRCCGPEHLGDCVLHTDESEWRYRWKNSIRYFRSVKVAPGYIPWLHWHSDVVLASALYMTGDGYLGVTPRLPKLSYSVGWVPSS